MVDIRRDSFSWTNKLLKTLFQTGRPVQEYELNEMQDNLRVRLAKSITAILGGDTTGLLMGQGYLEVTAGGTNEITVSAGSVLHKGYLLEVDSPTTITGLTTPGGARTDYLYLEAVENEVADPSPDPVLGVQSYRRQIAVSLKVVEGAVVPASTGDLWSGGTVRMKLAKIERTASATINLGMVTHYGASTAQDALKNYIFDGFDRAITGLRAGTEGRVRAEATTLKFKDTYVTTDAPLGDAIDATVTSLKNGLAATSTGIVRRLNGRAYVTVGDGVKTFGDYNGSTGLEAAIAAIRAFQVSNPAYPVTLHVKAGTYTRTHVSPSPFLGPVRVVGDGKGSSTRATIIQGTAATGGVGALETSGADSYLQLENLQLEAGAGTSGAYAVLALAGGAVRMRNVTCDGQTYLRLRQQSGSDFEHLYFFEDCSFMAREGADYLRSAVLAVVPNVASTRVVPLEFRGCSFYAGGLVTSPFCVHDPNTRGPSGTIVEWVKFSQCQFYTGLMAGSPSVQTGFLTLSMTANVDEILYSQCRFYTGGGGSDSLLLRLRLGRDADNTTDVQNRVGKLSFSQCHFESTDPTDIASVFRVETVALATTWDNSCTLSMNDCTFRLLGNNYSLDTAVEGSNEGAVIALKASQIDVRGLTLESVGTVILDAAPAAPTNWFQAILGISPKAPNTTPYHSASAFVSGVFFKNLRTGSGTGSPFSLVAIRPTIKGQVVLEGVCVVGTGLALNTGAWGNGAIISVTDTTAQDTQCIVRGCSIETDQDMYGIYAKVYRRALISENSVNVGSTAGTAFYADMNSAGAYCRAVFHGNVSLRSQYGIRMLTNGGEARGNTIYNASAEGIYANCKYAVIEGNEVTGCNGGATGAVQIRIPAGALGMQVVGNNCKDATTGNVGAIRCSTALAVSTFVGFDTGALGTFTNGANMSFNTATLNTT
jgi:hypothetical protein